MEVETLLEPQLLEAARLAQPEDLLLHGLGVEAAEVWRLLGRGEDVVEDAVPGQ